MDLLPELVKPPFGSLNAKKSCVTIFIRDVIPNVVNLRILYLHQEVSKT